MGFNLEAIRDLNKVTLYRGSTEVKTQGVEQLPVIIDMYTNKGWDLDFNLNVADFGGALNAINSPFVSSVVGEFLGVSTVIDITRKFAYQGSDPMRFNIPGFLLLKNNPDDDFVKPLNSLLSYILPTRGPELYDKLQKDVKENEGKAWDFLNKVLNLAEGYTKEIYGLNVPKEFEKGCLLHVKWSGHVIYDVFVKRVHISTDRFVYSTPKGTPIPSIVRIDLGCETSRVVTLDSPEQQYFKSFQ